MAWKVLERCGVNYETLTDDEGQAASDALDVVGIATTPSGAAGYGALCKRANQPSSGSEFRPLVIISEGLA